MGVKFESFPRSLKHKIHHTLRLERALRLVWQSGQSWTIASLTLLIVQGLLPLLSLYFMKLVLDAVAIGLTNNNKEQAFRQVVLFVGLAGIATLISILCNSLAGLVSTAQTQAVTDYMQGILQAKSLEVDLEYYENSQYYDTLQRAQQEAPYRPTRIVNGLVQIGQNGISLLAIAGLLLSFHWGIAIVLFLAAIPGVLVRLKYADQMYRWQRQRTTIERQTWYFNWMLTGDAHAKEMRLFALGSLFSRQFRHLRQKLYRENLAIATRRSVADLIAQTSAGLFVFAAYAFIAYRTLHGILTLGDLVMFSQAFQRGRGALQGVLGGFAGLYEDNLFLSNLYEFLDLKPKLLEPLHPKPIPRPMRTGIVFDRVSFQYSSTSRQALEDVTLIIRPGEVVALVGENGSGKTTLIKLLCRLYDPTQGSIAFDGIDLRQFNTAAWRREISVIFQDYAKYHLTARENIWFGNIDLPPDDQQIVTAARYAGADEVISSLPHGYETILGKWFEDGEELSIGQWQKIALARAFLRDAQIIVLDEPTSALDALAEHEVFKQFRQLVKGRTAILISHRLSTVKMADCIYVLENGRIVESGTHDQLVRREGTYAHLFETQAQYYR
jgi:ATP-binding cassette, subfamily B, bacterial